MQRKCYFYTKELQKLLVAYYTYKHHYIRTHLCLVYFALVYLFPRLGLSLFMSYLCDLFFIFIIIIISYNLSINQYDFIKTDSLGFLHIFQNISYYFWMKNANNFKLTKVQPQDVSQLLLDFSPISAWCCFMKVLFKSVQSRNARTPVNSQKGSSPNC